MWHSYNKRDAVSYGYEWAETGAGSIMVRNSASREEIFTFFSHPTPDDFWLIEHYPLVVRLNDAHLRKDVLELRARRLEQAETMACHGRYISPSSSGIYVKQLMQDSGKPPKTLSVLDFTLRRLAACRSSSLTSKGHRKPLNPILAIFDDHHIYCNEASTYGYSMNIAECTQY
jgi:hypothetical protein